MGLHKESGPSALDLESRRRALQAFFKALAQFHYSGWGTDQSDQAEAARLKIDLAIDDCQIQLPDLFKTLKKQKSGTSLIPSWQEPSVNLLEWALSLRGHHVALHLLTLRRCV